jgi:hypothetical protein
MKWADVKAFPTLPPIFISSQLEIWPNFGRFSREFSICYLHALRNVQLIYFAAQNWIYNLKKQRCETATQNQEYSFTLFAVFSCFFPLFLFLLWNEVRFPCLFVPFCKMVFFPLFASCVTISIRSINTSLLFISETWVNPDARRSKKY